MLSLITVSEVQRLACSTIRIIVWQSELWYLSSYLLVNTPWQLTFQVYSKRFPAGRTNSPLSRRLKYPLCTAYSWVGVLRPTHYHTRSPWDLSFPSSHNLGCDHPQIILIVITYPIFATLQVFCVMFCLCAWLAIEIWVFTGHKVTRSRSGKSSIFR